MHMVHYSDYRSHIEQMITAALAAADPATAVTHHLHRNGRSLHIGDLTYDLDQGRVFLVSVGKAAVPMAQAATAALADDLFAGIVITKKGAISEIDQVTLFSPEIVVFTAGHPVSDNDSVQATTAVATMLAQATEDDLVLCLISGGTSALLTQPLLSLEDWQSLNQALLASGCTISEFNSVRRQLDGVKGGGLAQMAAPARCSSLILSDVVGSPLAAIGSGPTVLGTETPDDALAVLARYDIEGRLATAVYQRIHETLTNLPAPTIATESENDHLIVGDVRSAAQAALAKAMQLGFVSQLLTAQLEGEAREVANVAAAIAKDTPSGRCLIMGGETTVTLRGDGFGGRNQELALAAAIALEDCPNIVIASFATDGDDGPTPAAGAVVNGETVGNGRCYNLDALDYLARNDSHNFFKQLDENLSAGQTTLLQPGPTGTNVNDLLFILTYPK